MVTPKEVIVKINATYDQQEQGALARFCGLATVYCSKVLLI
jgi:hypothetical protein